jgi:hypothetical protein
MLAGIPKLDWFSLDPLSVVFEFPVISGVGPAFDLHFLPSSVSAMYSLLRHPVAIWAGNSDEDERRGHIEGGYQLQSDIETSEQLTVKSSHPEDDLPILRDEIEAEDIDRSL